MTVGAAHIAFCDLGGHALPRVVVQHLGNVQVFGHWITMVEVEDQGIRFATIDTRVVEKVLNHKRAIDGPQAHPTSALLFDVPFRGSLIVGLVIRVLTSPTKRLQLIECSLPQVEIGEGLGHLAPPAGFEHALIVARLEHRFWNFGLPDQDSNLD